MDTLNAPLLDGVAYRWNSMSPSPLSDNEEDDDFCRTIKIERPFEVDYEDSFGTPPSVTQNGKRLANSGCSAIPLASCATAAASLSSAFCKRPNSLAKSAQLSRERSFQDGTLISASISIVKEEQTSSHSEGTQNSYSGSQSSFLSMSPEDCSRSEDSSLSNATAGQCSDAAQMDIYRDLILRHLIQDISTTCTKLGLPTDPYLWTAEHSGRWISDMCMQFQLPPPRQLFLSGRTLLSMNQEEFLARAPEGGDTLHAQLQLWKTAFESYSQQTTNGASQNASHVSQGNNRVGSGWVSAKKLTPLSPVLNGTTNTERLTSAQDYLNSFNPSTADVAPNMSYYSANNSNYQAAQQDSALFSGLPQQTFFSASHSQSAGILHSPSDSEISSNASSLNDGGDDDTELQLLSMRRATFHCQQGLPVGEISGSGAEGAACEGRSGNCVAQFPRHSGTVHLWHFIRELLDHPKQYSSCVRWVDREEGTFKIESSHHLARFWGQRKNRAQMNYDKLSRSLRQYYKKGIIQKPEKKQRLVYKFLPPYNL